MIKLGKTSKLMETKEDEYIYKELDNFLYDVSNLLSRTSEELTKTFFSHYGD